MSTVRACALVLAVAAAVLSCSGKDDSGKPSGNSSAVISKMIAAVPADAGVVFFLDMPKPAWDYITKGTIMPMTDANRAALEKELTAFLKGRLGLDVRQARAIVGFFEADQSGALMFAGVSGTLTGGPVIAIDEEIAVAHKDDILIVGFQKSVRSVVSTMESGDGLAKSDPEFANWIKNETSGALAGAGGKLSALAPLLGPIPFSSVEYAALAVSKNGIHIALNGDNKELEVLAQQLETAQKMGLSQSERVKTEMTGPSENPVLGALSILQYHTFKNLIDAAKPKVSGGKLEVGIPAKLGDDPTVFVAITGILAAIAVPAFMKYIKKSKTSEAMQFTKKLYDGARAYYMDPNYASGSIAPVAPQFPEPSAGPVPPLGACCDNGEKCAPNAEQWNKEPWISLQFSVDDPHYYSYMYEVSNTGADGSKRFTVRAMGDLDCDGDYSTFEMHGEVNSQFPDGPAGSAALGRINELE